MFQRATGRWIALRLSVLCVSQSRRACPDEGFPPAALSPRQASVFEHPLPGRVRQCQKDRCNSRMSS